MENEQEFLKELTELTKKYEIKIIGCGCCGSPALYPFDPDKKEAAKSDEATYFLKIDNMELTYTYPGEYHWDKYQDGQ